MFIYIVIAFHIRPSLESPKEPASLFFSDGTMPFLRKGPQTSRRPCLTLKTASPKPLIPPRAGAAKGVSDNDTPGFLMGAVAADQPECSSRCVIVLHPLHGFLDGGFLVRGRLHLLLRRAVTSPSRTT